MKTPLQHQASRNLRDTSGFDDRRALLSLGEPRGFIVIRVHAAKPFSVRIEDGDEPVVVFAAPIFLKCVFHFPFQRTLPATQRFSMKYRSFSPRAQVPREIVSF